MVTTLPDGDALGRRRFARARGVLAAIHVDPAIHAPQAIAALDTLSMGMSADLESAIGAGATIARIGSPLPDLRCP